MADDASGSLRVGDSGQPSIPAAAGLTMTPFSYSQAGTAGANNMIGNNNQQYQDFISKLPGYKSDMQNQAIGAGADSYNNQKQSIDKQANRRGLLYSGLKQGAEAGAAGSAAKETQNKIAEGNQNLDEYATNYGNNVNQAALGNYQGMVNHSLRTQEQDLQRQGQENQRQGSLLGGIGSLVGLGIAAFSDEKLKNDVKPADKEANDMVGKMKATTWSYKDDPKKETRLGIIAQDLEKSKMGKSMVIDTPKGKAVDVGKAISAVLAVQAALDRRLKKVGG